MSGLLISLYRIEAKVAFFADIVQAVKVRAQLHAVVAARAFYFMLYEMHPLFFWRGLAGCNYFFCFKFGFHDKCILAVAFKIWNTKRGGGIAITLKYWLACNL